MGYVIAAIALLFVALFFGFSRVNAENGKAKTQEKSAIVSEVQSMRESEIKERLLKLAKSPPPTKLSRGAMCYDPAMPLAKTEYVCPKCGEKTLYTSDDGPRSAKATRSVRMEIPACRRIVKQIKGLKIQLDETQFCAKCAPDLKEVPKICLVVHYEGEKEPHRVEGVTSEDLKILQEFLAGKDKHEGDFGLETPLKNHIERLEQLLGVKIADTENK